MSVKFEELTPGTRLEQAMSRIRINCCAPTRELLEEGMRALTRGVSRVARPLGARNKPRTSQLSLSLCVVRASRLSPHSLAKLRIACVCGGPSLGHHDGHPPRPHRLWWHVGESKHGFDAYRGPAPEQPTVG